MTPEEKEKILNRTEFKVKIDTLMVWSIAVKDPEDYRKLILGLTNYCKDLTPPDFSDAKDPALLNQFFKMEAEKQGRSAIKYARMCMERAKAGKKGGKANSKQVKANAKQKQADYDSESGSGSDIDIEDIDIDIGIDHPTSPAPEGGGSSEIVREKLPQNFWGDEDV